MQIIVSDEVKSVIEMINDYHYDAYMIGGAVRDGVLGIESNDYDLCTNMPLERMKELFPQFVLMRENNHRNTGVIRINEKDIEISSFHGDTIEEDLSKRDLTINAMACDKDGNIIDPFDGLKDLANKKIRLVKDNGEALDIDPLRILRVLRFAAVYGFEIDSNTLEMIKKKRELLKNVAVERIYTELSKILVTDNASNIIRNNKEIFCTIIPALETSIGFKQNNPHHKYDLFEHTLHTLDNTPKDIDLRLASLFHDLGKPSTYFIDKEGIGHFYGHEKISTKLFIDFADLYKIPHKTKEKVSKLIYYHDYYLAEKPTTIRKFLRKFGVSEIESLFMLKIADKKGQNDDNSLELEELMRLRDLYLDEVNKSDLCISIKDLKINGYKLMEMGFFDKKIGIILKDVLDRVILEDLENSEDKIEEYVANSYR